MERNQQPYYCYLQSGVPVIEIQEPQNFTDLPYHYTTYCPSNTIAEMIYKANLKIMKMRERQ